MRKIAFLTLLINLFAFANETSVLSSNGGRYVYGQISSMRADQYLLDTKTGRLWNMIADKDGNTRLQPVAIESMIVKDGKYTSIILDMPTEK